MPLSLFWLCYKEYLNEKEYELRNEWERARWQTLAIINYTAQIKASQKPTVNTEGFKFNWDKKSIPSWKQKYKSASELREYYKSIKI